MSSASKIDSLASKRGINSILLRCSKCQPAAGDVAAEAVKWDYLTADRLPKAIKTFRSRLSVLILNIEFFQISGYRLLTNKRTLNKTNIVKLLMNANGKTSILFFGTKRITRGLY